MNGGGEGDETCSSSRLDSAEKMKEIEAIKDKECHKGGEVDKAIEETERKVVYDWHASNGGV